MAAIPKRVQAARLFFVRLPFIKGHATQMQAIVNPRLGFASKPCES